MNPEHNVPTTTPRVFFVQRTGRFDTTPADRFGEKKFVVSAHASVFNPDSLFEEFTQSLDESKFNPDTDFVALTGQAIAVSMLTAYVLARWGRMRALLFDARTGEYEERKVQSPPPAMDRSFCNAR